MGCNFRYSGWWIFENTSFVELTSASSTFSPRDLGEGHELLSSSCTKGRKDTFPSKGEEDSFNPLSKSIVSLELTSDGESGDCDFVSSRT